MTEPRSSGDFDASLSTLSTADLVEIAADLNQQSLLLITQLMMIADELAQRDATPWRLDS